MLITSPNQTQIPRKFTEGDLQTRLDLIEAHIGILFYKLPQPSTVVSIANSLNLLSQLYHELNVDSGWWHRIDEHGVSSTGFNIIPRNFSELLMLTVSELMEGYDAGEEPDDKIPDFLGISAELGDTAIRFFDWTGAYGADIPEAFLKLTEENYNSLCESVSMGEHILELISWLVKIQEKSRKSKDFSYEAAMFIMQLVWTNRSFDLGVPEAIVAKTKYNMTREDHKPENRALADGKKF